MNRTIYFVLFTLVCLNNLAKATATEISYSCFIASEFNNKELRHVSKSKKVLVDGKKYPVVWEVPGNKKLRGIQKIYTGVVTLEQQDEDTLKVVAGIENQSESLPHRSSAQSVIEGMALDKPLKSFTVKQKERLWRQHNGKYGTTYSTANEYPFRPVVLVCELNEEN